MYRNYLTVAYRSLARQKVHFAINIVGLSVAIACLLLISLFIRDERSFDSFHTNADTIYRVIDCTKEQDASIRGGTVVATPVGPALMQNFPQVERAVRILWAPPAVVKYGDKIFGEDVRCVDDEFFQMFSFPLLAGDSISALKEPYSVVINEEIAVKYFGNDDPLGKTLTLSLGGEPSEYTVTAVSKQPPDNSTIDFSFLIPIERHPDYQRLSNKWNSSSCVTYVQISDPLEAEQLEKAIPEFLARMRGYNTPPTTIDSNGETREYPHFLGFQPLRDMHLNPHSKYGIGSSSTPERSYILAGIALLILLMACINFTTLAIGRLTARVLEVGARKALGANRTQLAGQFMTETQLLSFVAMIVGVALAELLLPVFNSLSGKHLSIGLFSGIETPVSLLVIAVIVGLLAGCYPALVMSKLGVVDALRGRSTVGNKNLVMRGLVVLQFALSIFLVASTAVMSSQMQFIRDTDLGYDSNQLLSIPTYTGWGDEGEKLLSRYRNRLAGVPSVTGVTGMDYSFSRGYDQEGWMANGESRTALAYRVDPDFIAIVGAELVDGRDFSGCLPIDATGAIIVNETLVREFGLDRAVGEPLTGWGRDVMRDSIDPTIVGVISDIHFGSLRRKITPVVLHLNSKMSISNILVRISPENIQSTLYQLEKEWRIAAPDKPFDYAFVDEHVAMQYRDVRRWEQVIGYSSAFAIVIAGLGLFGLASFAAEQRTKEIGIRKVLGATASGIVAMISKEFLILVTIANIIAWPVAYHFMNHWLQNFAYRTNIGIETFLLAGSVALTIALITVSSQAFKAARTNPVDSLKHE
ncbi:MAG: ABC transporter permease [candidate division Zixibacteria bacterium]|nr:ABC transporter permease [candidate division Zixibacteria bacterium]MBU1470144.1 ABC transporter permease [candidate division Zixibacteria bacterium]MBU2626013.1 ABC transporter permease [candidate division Zixibacteria bacterium]